MVTSKTLHENDIRNIVRDEISQIVPEFEIITESQLSLREKNLCLEAEEEYKKGETISFEEVYDKILDE
ncbi:MAG: hypothetical protein ACLFPL_01185 [Candidatus Nanoarchaeia archaeon]